MVTFVEDHIADDPTLRRLELIEVVLTHCATRMWKMVPEKQLKAPTWVKKVRDAIRAQKVKLSGRKRDGTSTPSKTGANGLYVASADAIACKAPSAPPSQHDSVSAPPSYMEGSRRDDFGGSGSFSHFSAPREGDGTSAASSPADAPPMHARVDSPAEVSSPLTAATTSTGDVVLVSSSGRQKSDSAVMKESSLPLDVPLKIKRLSGGITNELFHVYDEACVSSSVVVRIFGKETERVISRESELFYQSLFVETFVRGGNFLVYEYLDNYETLPFQDMGAEMTQIAKRVAEFHVRSTVAARLDFNPPLIHDASWKEVAVETVLKKQANGNTTASDAAVQDGHVASLANGSRATRSRFDRECNYTRHALSKWADIIQSAEIVDKVQTEKRGTYTALASRMKAECTSLLALLDKYEHELGEGACHNDLLSANFMRHRETGKIKIIDFDYTTRDYLLFDLANHFNEYTGLDCDYDRYFPSQEHIREFVVHYRQNMRSEIDAAHAALTPQQEETLHECIIPRERELFWANSAQEEDECVTRSVCLVNLLTVCSNLSWAVWSLVQEAVSTLDVDFLEYAQTRFARALDTKAAAVAALTIQ